MDELRQDFLNTSVSNLAALQKELLTADFFSNPFLQKLFRQLHTIKGTAQTFDFKISGNLAHEIENVLQALRENKLERTNEVSSTVKEGIQLLRETLENEQTNNLAICPEYFIEKVRTLIPNAKNAKPLKMFSTEIPKNLLSQLSVREIDCLTSAIQNGDNFFLIDVGFDFADFDIKLKEFREILNAKGEIIATSPSPNVDLSQQIGFQLFFVSKVATLEITKIIAPFKATLIFESKSLSAKFSNNLQGILAKIVVNGEKTARLLGKKIDFQTITDEISLAPNQLKTIYEILLHLTRNAIDHAIESPEERLSAQKDERGKIEIAVTTDETKIVLRVKDDGCGINTDKVIAKAVEQGLITSTKVLTENESLELLFAHGFSTSENVSEISGRGVGLDIVKEVVDKANGEIKIQTKIGQGTVFEVYLPQNI